MPDGLNLTVVTPERALVQEEVDQVQVPGLGGYLGLLPGHAPLFSELAIGELSYTREGRNHSIAVAKGFVEISNDKVRVLADVAEPAVDIDIDRAREALKRAEERISEGGDDIDYPRALAALKRATVRIATATRQ